MKKYVKPQLCYENFELSQFIAGECADGIIMNSAKGTCVTGSGNLNGEYVKNFFDAGTVCEISNELYCYTHSVTDFVWTFNS